VLVSAGTVATALLAGCTGTDSDGGGGTDGTPTDGGMDGTPTDGGMDDTPTDGGMDDTPTDGGMMATEFTVRVENVSTSDTLQTSEGSKPVPLSPVAYVVHESESGLFEAGTSATGGLERLAEDGSPTQLVEQLEMDGLTAGAASVPAGADEPGPIGPGGVYEFAIEAHAGQNLSLATMFIQSNDLFYAPEASGIALFDGEQPVGGEVTDRLVLWDAGTEANEEPGVGPNQAPRQMDADTGPSEDATVRRIADVDDGYEYPDTASVVKVTVTPGGMSG